MHTRKFFKLSSEIKQNYSKHAVNTMGDEGSRTSFNGIDIPKSIPQSWNVGFKNELTTFFQGICTEFTNLRRELDQAKAEIEALKKEKKSFSGLFHAPAGASTEEKKEAKSNKANVIAILTDEVKEQERVSKNITIRGIEVFTGDETEVKAKEENAVSVILDAIGISHTNVAGKTRRITKHDKTKNKRVPVDTIHVQLESKEEQQKVLAAARDLRKNPCPRKCPETSNQTSQGTEEPEIRGEAR